MSALNPIRKEVSMLTRDSIKKRVSCWAYKKGPLKESDQQKLKDFLLTNVQGPFGNRVRFEKILSVR